MRGRGHVDELTSGKYETCEHSVLRNQNETRSQRYFEREKQLRIQVQLQSLLYMSCTIEYTIYTAKGERQVTEGSARRSEQRYYQYIICMAAEACYTRVSTYPQAAYAHRELTYACSIDEPVCLCRSLRSVVAVRGTLHRHDSRQF